MSTRSPCRVEQLFFLARRDLTVRKPGNLERRWSFSLWNLKTPFTARFEFQNEKRLSFLFCFYSSYVLSLPLVKPSLAHWISYPLNPPTLDFYPIRRCHMSPIGPTLELKLTDSTPDMWHTMSHSKCAKCPTLRSLPRKTCKF